MLRNQRSRNDFMGMDNGYREQPMQPLPPVSQLDAQTERLAEQAEDIGWLKGQNDLLNEDNKRLETESRDLREANKTLQSRNMELEKREGISKGFEQAVDELIVMARTGYVEQKGKK